MPVAESVVRPQRPDIPATTPDAENLLEIFNCWFQVVPANTEERLEQAHRLRYQVYCVENPFEDPADNLGGLERDEFDDRALHSLLIHRPTGEVAGAVRLVLPRPGPNGPDLPISRVCDPALLAGPEMFPAETTAEISRFAIAKSFRRRREDGLYPNLAIPFPDVRMAEERRVLSHMTLGLLKGVMEMSARHGITHWAAVLEPALLRLLSRLGLHLNRIGPIVHYHGRRQSALADIRQLAKRTLLERPDVWNLCTDYGRLVARLEENTRPA